jgi:hypothetical protein
MLLSTYDPAEVAVSVGSSLLSGLAPQFISVSRSAVVARDELGTELEVVRWLLGDRRGDVEISLLATSPSNLVLSTFVNTDELMGTSVIPLIIKDLAGNSAELVVAPLCWVNQHAPITYSNGVAIRRWSLRTTSLRILQGRTS